MEKSGCQHICKAWGLERWQVGEEAWSCRVGIDSGMGKVGKLTFVGEDDGLAIGVSH